MWYILHVLELVIDQLCLWDVSVNNLMNAATCPLHVVRTEVNDITRNQASVPGANFKTPN